MWLFLFGFDGSPPPPPPLPEWVKDDDSSDDIEVSDLVVSDLVAGEGPPPLDAEPDCGNLEPEVQDHTWSVPGSVARNAFSTDAGARWVVATGRMGTIVEHWRQGPYGRDEEIEVVLPDSLLAAALASTELGTMSTRIIVQDDEGRTVDSEALPRLTWTLLGAVEGSPIFALHRDHVAETSVDPDGQRTISTDL